MPRTTTKAAEGAAQGRKAAAKSVGRGKGSAAPSGAEELPGLFAKSDLPKDILLQPMPEPVPAPCASRRMGVHMSTSGGVSTAIERAWRIGANTLQVFSSSPRQWRGQTLAAEQIAKTRELRERYGIGPMVVHANYLINCCSQHMDFRGQSVGALRGEVERALLLGAEFLVLHPGSWRGLTRDQGLQAAAESIAYALNGMPWQDHDFTILIENTAGSEFSLGGSLDQVAELAEQLRPVAPVGVCLDTCHLHVSGYDIVSPDGYEETMRQIESTVGVSNVRVWHCNDAKAACGSRLDRHQNIGEGQIGTGAFRRILNDARFRECAFVAETPVEEAGDEKRNLDALKALVV